MTKVKTTSTCFRFQFLHQLGTQPIRFLFVLLFTCTVLLVQPGCTYLKARQIRMIQESVTVDLGLILKGETYFYKEHGFYTTDMVAAKIWPKQVVYKFGFVRAAASDVGTIPGLNSELKDLDRVREAKPDWNVKYSPVTQLESIQFSSLEKYCSDCTATKTGFKAIAVANLDDDADLDVWTVNEKGEMAHVQDDLAEKR